MYLSVFLSLSLSLSLSFLHHSKNRMCRLHFSLLHWIQFVLRSPQRGLAKLLSNHLAFDKPTAMPTSSALVPRVKKTMLFAGIKAHQAWEISLMDDPLTLDMYPTPESASTKVVSDNDTLTTTATCRLTYSRLLAILPPSCQSIEGGVKANRILESKTERAFRLDACVPIPDAWSPACFLFALPFSNVSVWCFLRASLHKLRKCAFYLKGKIFWRKRLKANPHWGERELP